MKKTRILTFLLIFVLLATAVGIVAASGHRNFRTHLTGSEEVPAVDTLAQGQAIFKVNEAGDAIDYKLIVANIDNVLQSHIHLGPAGANAGVVAFLYPDAPPAVLIPGRSDGVLAEGTITAEDLRGALLGMSISDLVDAMAAGNTYVNVHTTEFPGGEIRGQID